MTATRTNDSAYQAIFNAAQVISLDHKIAAWLGNNDPKALAQLRGAIKVVQAEIDRSVALRALDEKFARITDMVFLSPEQENAVLILLDDVLAALTLRGRTRLSQKLAADSARLLSKYLVDTQEEADAARTARATKMAGRA